MPRHKDPDALRRACVDAWIDWDVMPDEIGDEKMKTLAERWGGLSVDAFKQALQEGLEPDRVLAIFALGYLAPAGVEELLVPFLHSPIRKERWASAIALGENRDERAFALLLDLLEEGMEYQPSHVRKDLDRSVFEAIWETMNLFGPSWERQVDPALVTTWNEQLITEGEELADPENQAHDDEYTWHTSHRITITNLLGTWEDERAIPALRQTLQKCWEIECPPFSQRDTLRHLEHELAYALGQLEAWNALDGLDTLGFPPFRFKLARLYLIFGSFHLNLFSLEDWNINTFIQTRAIDPDRVTNILQERFGLDEYVARANLKVFQQWYKERRWK